MQAKKVPSRLYKYRHFDSLTLESIVNDTVFFADPSTFNDPLDTRPSLKLDIEESELTEILETLVEQRTTAEMRGALKEAKVGGQEHLITSNGIVADRPKTSYERSTTSPRIPTRET